MRRTIPALATLIVVTLGAALLGAENWPQWRGPELNGLIREAGLVRTWSPTTNIAWKLPTPSRTGSTPVIWGDTVFLSVATTEFSGDLELWAVDRKTQAVTWKKPLGSGNRAGRNQNTSSPSPVTDGRTVWVVTRTGIIKAFDFAGSEQWTRDIQKEDAAFGLGFGDASSPLLLDEDLIVQVLHGLNTDGPSYVLRIDGATGKTEWKVERPTTSRLESPDAHTTPAVVHRGRASEIVITGGDVTTGHEPGTGREIWRVTGLNPQNAANYHLIASPTVWKGIVIAPARVHPMLAPGIPPPVTDGSLLYTVHDNGAAFALDLETGAVVYGPERLPPGTYSGSPVFADGHIYVTNEEGLTSVYRAGARFEFIAQNTLNDECLSSIAISEGQIFVRTSTHLWAIGERRK